VATQARRPCANLVTLLLLCAQGLSQTGCYSGDLLQTLLKHDLIDALRIWQFPVVIGTGKRLFGEGTIPGSFRLVDTQLATTGAVLHVYERAGDLRYGEVEVGQETVIFDSDAAHNRR
jgi:hypothetical protein